MVVCVEEVGNGTETGHVTLCEGVMCRTDLTVTLLDVLNCENVYCPTEPTS